MDREVLIMCGRLVDFASPPVVDGQSAPAACNTSHGPSTLLVDPAHTLTALCGR